MSNKTAVVIGATGLVGSALVEQLAQSEHISKVITLTRRPAEHPSAKVSNHVVDFACLENNAALFRADLLFSCLGTTLKQAGSIAAQRRVDLDYQYSAAQLAASKGVEHYLLVSSSGANANSHSQYLKMKGELQEKVKSLPFKRISILQPSLLIGARNHLRWGEKIAGWLMPLVCTIPGLRRYRPITGEQVAAKMRLLSEQPGEGIAWFSLDKIFLK